MLMCLPVRLLQQQGASLSRSRVIKFKHNDVEDLRQILEKIQRSDTKDKAMKQRRFIVVEGIYYKTGARAPLNEIVMLKVLGEILVHV